MYDFDLLLEMRALFGIELDKLKKDKAIKSSLELGVVVNDTKYLDLLDKWLIISNASNDSSDKILSSFKLSDSSEVFIIKSQFNKCPRCWKFNALLEGNVCARCDAVLKNM